MSSALELDDPDLILQEDVEVTGFLISEQTAVQTVTGDGETGFLLTDGDADLELAESDSSFLVTDAPGVDLEVPEEDLDEAFLLAYGRGPQGPPSTVPGPQGPPGAPGEGAEDLPDLTTMFENSLF